MFFISIILFLAVARLRTAVPSPFSLCLILTGLVDSITLFCVLCFLGIFIPYFTVYHFIHIHILIFIHIPIRVPILSMIS